jgi:hypothetical protein
MDGNTEPIVAVIGHPIAGNPSQFAFERALQSLSLEWRVFSFDVPPDKLGRALDGLEVLGVRGVLIDDRLAPVAGRWRAGADQGNDDDAAETQPAYVDCLFRDAAADSYCKHGAANAWFQSVISEHAEAIGHAIEKTILIGDPQQVAPWHSPALDATIRKLPRNTERILEADLIVIAADDEAADLELEDWPDGDDSILVFDFSSGHPDLSAIESLGYKVISPESRRIGTLIECFRKWTSKAAPFDTIHEAIEEYLAV